MKPDAIRLHRASRCLEICWPDGLQARLRAEYLRVFSPSAEVQGHGPDQAVLQLGKQDVAIDDIRAQGHYGLRILFDDGHDTGIFTWPLLRDLAVNEQQHWTEYLQRVQTHHRRHTSPQTIATSAAPRAEIRDHKRHHKDAADKPQ